jgi:drug/metabolite transporter (DMT)-like permease
MFLWLTSVCSVVIYAPLAFGVVWLQRPHIGWLQLGFIAGTALLHTVYFLLLARGYRFGDLSLVYPLARGTGPLITIAGAMLILHERPSPVALAGAVMVAIGVFLLTGDPHRLRTSGSRGAVLFALLTGTSIAAYSVWDKVAVAAVMIPPLLLDWAGNLMRMGMLTPIAVRSGVPAATAWRSHRRDILGVAVLSPLAYILVLTAMVYTPVSYVAPAREISILVAALMGTHFLGEGSGGRRMLAAAVMVLGVTALALG